YQLDHIGGANHRRVEYQGEHCGGFQPVVATVNVQDGDDDQITEDECDHAAEARSAIPEHRCQRHVTDRADERHHCDQRADERADDLGECRVVGCEDAGPEGLRHPRRHGT
nr:hypothetical protein [Tanacetum cinerariifolium]